MVDLIGWVLAFVFTGVFLGWKLRDALERKRRRILSNWEPGMKITTSDGETLYVCAVEPTDSPGAGEKA